MSLWRVETTELRIGADAVTLVKGGVRTDLACTAGDWSALASELGTLLTRPQATRMRVAVSLADCWVRYFLLAPPEGVTGLRDCRLLLTARFEALYGQSAVDWVLQADWQAGAPMLACALPRALSQALAPLRLARVQPDLLRVWNRHYSRLPASGALCVNADGLANLLYWDAGMVRLVRQQRHQGAGDIDALLALELARLAADLPATRFWNGAGAPAGWTELEAGA